MQDFQFIPYFAFGVRSSMSILTSQLYTRRAAGITRWPRAKPDFLPQLPAELRNNIYAIALADGNPDRDKASSYKGLNGVCRQIRAEFWPLFWRRADLYITSNQIPAVLKTFFSPTATNPVYPHSITVTVDETRHRELAYMNILPLLQAKPLQPETNWIFVPSESNWGRKKAEWRKEVVENYVIPHIYMNPDARAAADCGLLEEVFIEMRANTQKPEKRHVVWHLTVQSNDGHLSDEDKGIVEDCCRELRPFDRFRYFDSLPQYEQRKMVTVVRGLDDTELYVWDAKRRKLDLRWHGVVVDPNQEYECSCCH